MEDSRYITGAQKELKPNFPWLINLGLFFLQKSSIYEFLKFYVASFLLQMKNSKDGNQLSTYNDSPVIYGYQW